MQNPLDVFLTPHWHIDYAWIKSHKQYMRELVLENFEVLFNILQRHPEYKCSVEQATQWMSLKEMKPDLFEKLKGFVSSENIDLVGGQILSPDINIPSGESLIRQYFYGKRFLKKEFKKDTNIAWNIDLFGHNYQYPLILRHMGMKYYVFHRGVDDAKFRKHLNNLDTKEAEIPPHLLYYWKSLNGQNKILAYYQTNTYTTFSFSPVELLHSLYFVDVIWHRNILSRIIKSTAGVGVKLWNLGNKLPTRSALKTVSAYLMHLISFKPYKDIPEPKKLFCSVGSDFSAPSSYILHYWNYLNEFTRNKLINLHLTTPTHFFNEVEKAREILKECNGEFHHIDRIFSGVWSSRIKLKQNNRRAEIKLYDIEALSIIQDALNKLVNSESIYPFESIDELWKTCLINQFHDISCGCCIDLVYSNAMRRYKEFFSKNQKKTSEILRNIAKLIIRQKEPISNGIKNNENQYLIINTLPWKRKTIVNKKIIENIPPLGYKVVRLATNTKVSLNELNNPKARRKLESNSKHHFQDFKCVFENNKLVEVYDSKLKEIILKANGDNWIGSIRMLEEKGDSYDSLVGNILQILDPKNVFLKENNDIQTEIEIHGEFYSGDIEVVESIKFIHWNHSIEISIKLVNDVENIKLEFCIPHNREFNQHKSAISFGTVTGSKGLRPVQNWVSFSGENCGICLVNFGTPEHIYHKPNCYITLLRTFDHIAHVSLPMPRKTPLGLELGNYDYRYVIKPFTTEDLEEITLENMSIESLHPCFINEIDGSDAIPLKDWSLLEIPKNKVSISAIKRKHPNLDKDQQVAVNNGIVLRLYNPSDRKIRNSAIRCRQDIFFMEEIDGNEDLLESNDRTQTKCENGAFQFSLDKYDLKSYLIQFD
ncbi:MAG: hypothetical protein GF364_19905, partial [Candidatus Lokiarchaeota archaeon]|nr:hypothetical protein [Candidatus Lokiarchaeota archaeon]